jgi:hypothetical protein
MDVERGQPVITAATDLRTEHLTEAVGIHVRDPRLSWRLPPDRIVLAGRR